MASIEPRTTPGGERRWVVRYRDLTGKQRARSFTRKTDAERHRAGVIADLNRGEWIDPDDAKRPLSTWAPAWINTKTGLASIDRHQGILDNHILPRWANTPVSAITHDDVVAWLAELEACGQSASSRRKIRDVLSGILTVAERAGAVRGNPAAGIRVRSDAKAEMRFLTGGQVEVLAAAIEADGRRDLGALVRFAAGTGLRRSELLRAQVRDVDVSGRQVAVRGSKSDAATRAVPLTAALVPVVEEQIGRARAGGGWLFPNTAGGQLDGNGFYRRHYQPATRAAGLAPLRFHDLRHTFAAMMIAAKADPMHLMRWMGHSSIKVTFDVYGHLYEQGAPEVMSGFDDVFRADR